jgi:hypothetical protein
MSTGPSVLLLLFFLRSRHIFRFVGWQLVANRYNGDNRFPRALLSPYSVASRWRSHRGQIWFSKARYAFTFTFPSSCCEWAMMIRYALPVRPTLGDSKYLYSNFRALCRLAVRYYYFCFSFAHMFRFVGCSLIHIVIWPPLSASSVTLFGCIADRCDI